MSELSENTFLCGALGKKKKKKKKKKNNNTFYWSRMLWINIFRWKIVFNLIYKGDQSF